MKFVDMIEAFLKGSKTDSVTLAAIKSFSTAGDRWDNAFDSISVYIERANHRYALLEAQRAINKASEKCFTDGVNMDALNGLFKDDAVNSAAAAYDEVRAEYHNPADFEPYTVDYLAGHTTAMDTLATTFDEVSVAFAALRPTHHLYASAAALYNLTCNLYEVAAEAYHNAAHCALMTALEGKLQALRDDWDAKILNEEAANPDLEDLAAVTSSKAAALKAKAMQDAAGFKTLEKAARIAEGKAAELLAKAKSAHSQVEAVLESLNHNDA